MDINVAFDGGNLGGLRKSAEEAYYGEWTISVSAAGYVAQARKFVPLDGMNTPLEFTLEVGNDDSWTFIDGRDRREYKFVTIGTQTWMAENLNYRTPNGLSRCYENDADDGDNSNCETYGRLYDWATAMGLDPDCNTSTCENQASADRDICPAGWHVPSDAEWTTLTDYVGGLHTAGTKLKSRSGWNSSGNISANGTDEFGFTALPGGYGWGGDFFHIGGVGTWWSATEIAVYGAWLWAIDLGFDYVHRSANYKRNFLLSVRCVRND